MTVWAISVAGIILLTVLSDTIIPDGKTSKYIKTVTTLVAILVMISPLPSILNGDIPILTYSEQGKEMELDQNYLNFVYAVQIDTLEQKCIDELNKNGYSQMTVNVTVLVQNNMLSVKNVAVNIKNMVINSSVANIDIIEDIKTTLSKFLSIEKSQVTIYG